MLHFYALQATALLKKAKILRESVEGPLQSTWRRFEDSIEVSVAAGALNAETLKAKPLKPNFLLFRTNPQIEYKSAMFVYMTCRLRVS
jgi:hypothetical protein